MCASVCLCVSVCPSERCGACLHTSRKAEAWRGLCIARMTMQMLVIPDTGFLPCAGCPEDAEKSTLVLAVVNLIPGIL